MDDDLLQAIQNYAQEAQQRQEMYNGALYMLINSLPDKKLVIKPQDFEGIPAGGLAMQIEDNVVTLSAHTTEELSAMMEKAQTNPTQN